MTVIVTEVFVIFVLLLINGVLSMSEIAVVTSRHVRLERRAADGDRGAQVALGLAREPTQFLSTVQVGITLVGVLAGAFGGSTLAAQLADWLTALGVPAEWSHGLALFAVVGVITYLSLVIGELVPKRIGLNTPERIASRVAPLMRALSTLAKPVVRALTASTELALQLAGVEARPEDGVTEEEIRALVQQGAATGVVQPAEQAIVERTFRLGDLLVGSIMTPRPDIDWISLALPQSALDEEIAARRHSRVLLCRDVLDHIIGFVGVVDILATVVSGTPLTKENLVSLAVPPLFVPENAPVFRLLEQFRDHRAHAAVVVDEYGAVVGVVTLYDILRDLVGNIDEGTVPPDGNIVRRDDGSWLVDGQAHLTEVEQKLGRSFGGGSPGSAQTIAGYVLATMGRIPRVSERVERAGLRFEVIDMDDRRIDKLLISTLPTTAPDVDAGSTGQ